MTTIYVFDPAMCCSTGICGPSIDPRLVRFAADLDWLKDQGVSVERFNLSQQPGAFAQDTEVKAALQTKGEEGLPLVKVNGEVKSIGTYPSREELATWSGVTVVPSPPVKPHRSLKIMSSEELSTKEEASDCCSPSVEGEASEKKPCC